MEPEGKRPITEARREYLREYQRRRYHEDPEWRVRRLEGQKERRRDPAVAEAARERSRRWRAARTPEEKAAFQEWLKGYKREWRRRRAIEGGDAYYRRQNLERTANRYGISPADYERMLEGQSGLCAICSQPETAVIFGRPAMLGVDHDHACCPGKKACGKCVRGLLCAKCNTMLGGARDDPAVLQAALAYLSR